MRFDILRDLVDLSIRVSSAGNPPRVQANSYRDIHRRHVSAGRKPTEEITDRNEVTLVSDISYLFSAGTCLIFFPHHLNISSFSLNNLCFICLRILLSKKNVNSIFFFIFGN